MVYLPQIQETGGMRTKIEAADKCTSSGIQTLIVNGRKGETFDALLEGKVPGTLFNASSTPASARRLWLTHTLKTAGRIDVDIASVLGYETTDVAIHRDDMVLYS